MCFLEKLREKTQDKVRKECLKKIKLNLIVFNLYCDEIRAQNEIFQRTGEAELLVEDDWWILVKLLFAVSDARHAIICYG